MNIPGQAQRTATPVEAPIEPVGPTPPDLTRISALTGRDEARVETLQVIVKEETPFLPKVAFTLISLASLAGATFTGTGMGIGAGGIVLRWITLWSLGLAGGFLVWRLLYLRTVENDIPERAVGALNATALDLADTVMRRVAPIVLVGAPGALVVPHLAGAPVQRFGLVLGSLVLAGLLAFGVRRHATAVPAVLVTLALVIGWAWSDTGGGWHAPVRVLHLTAFSLWLGGALWNIAVAMPAGRQHAYVDAVLTGARQLDRFRWVVRFSLPTIIVTGLLMAGVYRSLPMSWWTSLPGVLIPLKVVAIIALVVVFITCPLFRHCSPVQGVCNVDDLGEAGHPEGEHPEDEHPEGERSTERAHSTGTGGAPGVRS